MRLEIATEKHNAALIEFFASFHVGNVVQMKIQRGPDFFAPYRINSSDFRSYILVDSKTGKIGAHACFVIKDTIQHGESVRVAYAVDWRLTNSRKAILEWSRCFLPVLAQVRKDFGVQHIFSAIDASEKELLETFVRPRNMRRPVPRYYLYRKVFLNTIHGKWPWAPSPLPSLRIREATPTNVEALVKYLNQRNSYKSFATQFTVESFMRSLSQKQGVSLSNYLLAFDAQENIVGCTAVCPVENWQNWIPLSYSLNAHNFRQFLKFGNLLGWTRALTKPVNSTGIEAPLRFCFMRHLAADNEDIFASLVHAAFFRLNKNQFLVYAQSEQDFRMNPPPAWISGSLPIALYTLLDPQESIPHFLHPSESANPELEPMLLL